MTKKPDGFEQRAAEEVIRKEFERVVNTSDVEKKIKTMREISEEQLATLLEDSGAPAEFGSGVRKAIQAPVDAKWVEKLDKEFAALQERLSQTR